MNQSMILAHNYNADYEFCSKLLASSVLLMIIIIPLLTLIIGYVFPSV